MKFQPRILVVGGVGLVVLFGLVLTANTPETLPQRAETNPATENAAIEDRAAPDATARTAADRVIHALQAHDSAALAAHVHHDGVRISPSAYVDVSSDVVLRPAEAAKLWTDKQLRTWGNNDASGKPISLTPADYARRYIVDRDYGAAKVTINGDTERGTTIDNSAKVYPGATRVEYFMPGNDAMDWSALRLVFIPVGQEWRLVGIIHDAWAP